MKKLALLSVFLALPLMLGCPNASTTTPPAALAPGFLNQADQQMFQILSGARTFFSTVKCETQGLNWSQAAAACVSDPNITSPLALSATEKTAFNNFNTSLNLAETVYKAFKAGTATQDAAQAQVNVVQAQQQALPALAVTK